MRRLIVSGDDVGLHPGINAGVLRCHREGILTSASVCPSGAAFEEAVAGLRGAPDLDIGVHLTLVGESPTLPAERHDLIHPALDDIIAQASSDYIRAFHTRNVIGHGNRWREGKIFKCAAKGDLSRYSRVLSDPVVGEHFTRYLGSEFEKCKREVEYAA